MIRIIINVMALILLTGASAAGGIPGTPTPAFGPCTGGAGTAVSTPASAGSGAPAAMPAASTASGPVLRPVADVPLPGHATRFDYQQLDASSGRLYIAHMGDGQLVVVDIHSRRVVGQVNGLPGVTGVLVVPALNRVFVSVTGNHQVVAIDSRTLRVTARLGPVGFPDGLDVTPSSGLIYVSDESGGGEFVLDPRRDRHVTTIDVGGEAGNTHVDPISGCVLVAVQTRDQLVAIDPASNRIVGRDDLDPRCHGPHGFVINAPDRLAYITCEDNALLLVVDLVTMQTREVLPVGGGPDVLAFDQGWRRLYVASESGVVSVFAATAGLLEPLGTLRLPHAHSVAIDPATHLVYLPLENVSGHPVLRILAGTPP
jgi:DNA-binding beta-propeller fold protein YncE